jgi:signal transduction histidine kinase
MRLPSSENFRWYGMVLGLVAVLTLLAVLQYQSAKAVSEATTAQMQASLQGSLMDVRQGLERELTPLCRELQSGSDDPRQNDLEEYVLRFDRWRRAAAHPNLVAAVYVLRQINGSQLQLFKLNSTRTTFEPVAWPAEFENLHQRLVDLTPVFGPPDDGRGGPGSPPEDGSSDQPPFGANQPPPGDFGPPPDGFGRGQGSDTTTDNRAIQRSSPGQFGQRLSPRPYPPGSQPPPESYTPWLIDEHIPALVHRTERERRWGSNEHKPEPSQLNWIVIILNRDVLSQHILPELVQHYFGKAEQSSYEIAVVDSDAQAPELYTSDPGFTRRQGFVPDGALNFFGRPVPIVAGRESLLRGVLAPSGPAPKPTSVPAYSIDSPAGFHEEGLPHIAPIHYAQGDRDWEIVAKHREGSVEAAVAALSRRNLIFNFAVLLVLAATMAMIIATSQRARRLGELQMNFVANVSHELRTPLTGIVSAAQNIADGLIDDKEKQTRYGQAIVGQAQQLSDLVEQILLFSATRKDRHRYHFQTIDIAELVDSTLQANAALIQSAGITVEREVQSDLPAIFADPKALSQCLQNLIGNAIKYGGDSRWLGIQASSVNGSNGKAEIRVSISDRGIGISKADQSHIFEPFYRSSEVTAAQIHGNGLGLPLAKTITEDMGGRLTVQSNPGKGSTFTLHLPAK